MYGILFEEVRIPLYTASTQTILAKYTDGGKVPVLHDRGVVVWDSLAICEYVSERYLDGKGWPSEGKARAEARSCSAEMHSGFFQIREKLPMNCRAISRNMELSPGLEREVTRINNLWVGLRQRYADQGPWLFGEFSIADCMFAPIAFRFRTYGVSVPEVCSNYMKTSLENKHMVLWSQQAKDENETIEAFEVGNDAMPQVLS